jgi:hypothetical protein
MKSRVKAFSICMALSAAMALVGFVGYNMGYRQGTNALLGYVAGRK